MAETLKEIVLNLKIEQLEEKLQKYEQELQLMKLILVEIPECKAHGKGCVPHAIGWVKKMKAIEDAIENRHWEKEAKDGT